MNSSKRPDKSIRTRSGRILKVNRSLGEQLMAKKDAKSRRKADRMRGLPKSRLKRIAWRMNPTRLKEYWFSRDGAIMALKVAGIGILFFFLLALGTFAYFRKDLPNITDISGTNLGGSISYYDRTGQTLLWQDYNAVKRVPVASSSIPKYMKDATVAVEDKSFYTNHGFDIRGIARAAFSDLLHGHAVQGGSTITEQLVKLTQDFHENRTIALKAKELILAVELDRTYSKDQILTGYLNAAPYGGVDYGVQAAASDYFHENASQLTLSQAVFLAAIPQSPAYYSPYDTGYFDKQALADRMNYIYDQMVSQKMITKAQADAAKKVDVLAEVQPQQTKYAGIQAPYFVLAAKNQLLSRCSATNGNCSAGGWKVITTLDLNLQKKAEGLVQQNVSNIHRYGADEEALVAEDTKTGQMLALVGGTDFNNPDHGQINYAQINISPGSSFKPYDYATFINNNTDVGAGSVLYDVQQPLPGYPCTNKGLPPPKGQGNCLEDYDFRYPGPETLRYALGGSRNVPAVKAMLSAVPNDTSPLHVNSVNKVISTADSMMSSPNAYKCFDPGVDVNTATSKDQTQCYGASAIGDGAYLHLDQHVNGLSSMARLGLAIPQTYILKIENSANKTIYEWKQPKLGDAGVSQAVKPESAYIVDNMLSDPNASYLPGGYYKWQHYNGWDTAVKTGTTNNGFDGLMMGWNTQFTVGSWVGYHTRNRALSGAMEYMTTPLTKGLMTYALDSLHTKPVNWTEPAGIKHLPAYVIRTHIGIGSVEPSPSTDIFPSWYVPKSNATSASSVIDKVSNKLATSCTPTLARQTVGGNSSDNVFSADIFYPPGGNASNSATTTASDDVHSCSDVQPLANPPTVTNQTGTDSNGNPTCTVGTACTFNVTVIQGTHPFNDPQYPQFPGTINLIINGQVAATTTISSNPGVNLPYTVPGGMSYTPTSAGTASVTVQVIDSVLYDATSSPPLSMSFTAASPPPNGQQNNTNTNGSTGGVMFVPPRGRWF